MWTSGYVFGMSQCMIVCGSSNHRRTSGESRTRNFVSLIGEFGGRMRMKFSLQDCCNKGRAVSLI